MSREEIEQAVRTACDAGDYDEAATAALKGYGPEILGFLVSRLNNEGAAGDAFSLFSEDLWKGLPRFEWRSTVRVWAYTLARHAAARWAKRQKGAGKRRVPLSRVGRASQIAAQVRDSTLPYLRTQVKSRMRALYDRLPEEDQTVLTLRLDKQLSFRDIAEIMLYDGERAQDAAIAKESARLRKRFQLAKERLRKLAEQEGLLG